MNEVKIISARTLGLLNLPEFCPRCFWIMLRCDNRFPYQIPMPGIFSSIDSWSKRLIHAFFNQHAAVPPWFPLREVRRYLSGSELHWSKFQIYDAKTKIILRGTPDDVWQLQDASYFITDYKTAKVTKAQDELFPMYDVQLNAYGYIAQIQGWSPISGASLIYTEPQTNISSYDGLTDFISEDAFSMKFKAVVKPIKLRAETLIPELLQRTREILDLVKAPEGREECKNCELLDQLLKIAQTS